LFGKFDLPPLIAKGIPPLSQSLQNASKKSFALQFSFDFQRRGLARPKLREIQEDERGRKTFVENRETGCTQ
jgi:hypothetical protein